MNIAVIGASGFVGQQVVRHLLDRSDVGTLVLMDKVPGIIDDPRVTKLKAGLEDGEARAKMIGLADRFIVLSGILGGGAEADPALARRVNVDATLDLFEELAALPSSPRVVFASTVAVLGNALPDPVNDTTPANPVLLYGAQKLMMEVALANYSERGQVDGLSLRPSGIMARDGLDSALKTAFMSRLFHAIRRGQDIELPVGPDDPSWFISIRAVADCFVHAAIMPTEGLATGDRTIMLPALRITFGGLVAALRRQFPESRSRVTYAPDEELVRLFGQFPRLETERAERLGFPHDDSPDDLVRKSMS